MSEILTVGLQEAEQSSKTKVETVLPDTLYLYSFEKTELMRKCCASFVCV